MLHNKAYENLWRCHHSEVCPQDLCENQVCEREKKKREMDARKGAALLCIYTDGLMSLVVK